MLPNKEEPSMSQKSDKEGSSLVPPKRTSSMSSATKKAAKPPKLSLERIIGCTASSNAAFACNPNTGELAYPAGCVVVIYSPKKNKQTRFLQSPSNKPIISLAYSTNGKLLAVGEEWLMADGQSGHQPSVIVWEISSKKIIADLKGHTFGVSCISFSPNNKHLVSVGTEHDGHVMLWDYKANNVIGANKIKPKIHSVVFSDDGSFFVTAGVRHLKFWQVEPMKKSEKIFTVPNKKPCPQIDGRSPTGPRAQDVDFIDIACGKGPGQKNAVYAITSKGNLSYYNAATRTMERWVSLKAAAVYAVSTNDRYVVCSCSNGHTRIFSTETLDYVNSLPRPHQLGKEYLGRESVTGIQAQAQQALDVFPDGICCRVTSDGLKLGAIYSDHSMFVWNLREIKKIGKYRSFLAHSGCIWDIDVFPEGDKLSPFPSGSFVTSSADGTIRVWNTNGPALESQMNIFGIECLRTLYLDKDMSHMKARSGQEVIGTGACSIRCVKLSPDGLFLASGDRSGNVRVHDMHSLSEISYSEAHDEEVLSLAFSQPKEDGSGPLLLASGSRDHLIHVFDINNRFQLVHSLADHSSSITSIQFANQGTKLLSCGADRSILFREVQTNPIGFKLAHTSMVHYGTVFDMDIDPTNRFVVTAGQEKKLNVYTIATGKSSRSYKTEGECGETLKVKLDPAGLYAATSSADKNIRLYDFFSGDFMTKVCGHSEVVTGLAFSRDKDCSRLLSVSGDSCIFIWKLSPELSANMEERLSEINRNKPSQKNVPQERVVLPPPTQKPKRVDPAPDVQKPIDISSLQIGLPDIKPSEPSASEAQQELHDLAEIQMEEPTNDILSRFSETGLPSWAKSRQRGGSENSQKIPNAPVVAGRWAQRVEHGGIPLFSELSSDDKPVAKWADKVDRRLTVEVKSLLAAEADQSTTPQFKRDNPMLNSIRNDTNREEEDEMTYTSDVDEVEEETEAEAEAEAENETEAEAAEAEQETIFFGSEDSVVVDAPQTITKTEEVPDAPEAEEEESKQEIDMQFTDIEQADFLRNNFESLAAERLEKAANPLRLSYSSQYRGRPPLQPDGPPLPSSTSTTSHDVNMDFSLSATQGRAREQKYLREAEKTRARLEELGYSSHNWSQPNDARRSTTSIFNPPLTIVPPSTTLTASPTPSPRGSQTLPPLLSPKNSSRLEPIVDKKISTEEKEDTGSQQLLDYILRTSTTSLNAVSAPAVNIEVECQQTIAKLETSLEDTFMLLSRVRGTDQSMLQDLLSGALQAAQNKIHLQLNPMTSTLNSSMNATLTTDPIFMQNLSDMIAEKVTMNILKNTKS
ncbi:hypothetical protein PROFUN_02897 [Planoprotostelium fungivorum]|uniref:MABP1/WDR62 second WD40 domain-containing protein n=1 Tax=Planoprotostelium fungivorum TaxID=1890364 RepID=A0A2P6NS99_9EUKA|nr:hypothetical protein PROFUN_02897 [Planoprotostelium fungivorum]